MRKGFIYALAVIFLSFVGGSTALANTTSVSQNPSYASGPFEFYCQPYLYSFTSGKHYMPTNGTPCTFSLPNTIGSGDKIIAVYKGTPGNSSIVSINTADAISTLMQADTVSWSTPEQDQDYFAAVYPATDAQAFADYFMQGGTLPNNHYSLIAWKWGAQPASEFEPVIIIPGILGSWEKNGDWVIDPILHTYDNLIDTFLANGYVKDKTLFTFGYDWEEPNEVSADLLAQKIADIKQTCGCDHVNLIGHSMGGLVASQYIESTDYKNDVDQLFLVATPLEGAPYAYNTWEGGVIKFDNIIQTTFLNIKFNLEARKNGYSSVFNYIQNKPIESIYELLPVYNDYLSTATTTLEYPVGYPVNGFLENLVKNFGPKVLRQTRTNIILADNTLANTLSSFTIEPSTQLPLWQNGKPTQDYYDAGDGTVPRVSIENLVGAPDQEFDGVNHLGIASTSAPYIFKQLTNKDPDIIVGKGYDTLTSFIFFQLFSPIDMQIIAPDGKKIGKDFTTNEEISEIPGAFYSGFDTDNEYAIIPNPLPGEYKLETIGTGDGGEYTIVADYASAAPTTEAVFHGSTNPAQIIDHTVSLSSVDDALDITGDPSPSTPDNTLTPDSCIVDMANAYQAQNITQTAYGAVVVDCEILKMLFKNRDNGFSHNAGGDIFQNALLTTTFLGIRLTLDDMGMWANKDDNTKDGIQLINSYITWFKDHDLHH